MKLLHNTINLKKKVVEDAARAKAAEEAKKKAEAEERHKEGEGKTKPKEKKERIDKELEIAGATQPTVSSLRAIGGGIAGEVAKTDEFHRTTIAVQKEIRDILKEINGKGGLENTDFTKPVPNIVPVPTLGRGKGPTMVA
jgi:membrane protein involved in colicin uptake